METKESSKEKQRARQRAYYYKHQKERQEYAREYYKKNELVRKKTRERNRYYAFRKRAKDKGYNPDDFKFVWEKKIDLKALKKKLFIVFDSEGKTIGKFNQKQIFGRFEINVFELLLCVENGTDLYGMFFDEV